MKNNYLIYVYEFNEYVYIGLTQNLDIRHKTRINDKKDTVYKFCYKNNIPIPEPKILESSLTAIESQSKEQNWVDYYTSIGKIILNKGKCGIYKSSLGGKSCIENEKNISSKNKILCKTKQRQKETTYDKCYNIAKQYKYKRDFEKENGYEYRYSKKMGWLNDFSWLEAIKKKSNKKELTYENYLKEVKKYNTKSDFSKNSRKFYILGLKNGWNNDFFNKDIDIHISEKYNNVKLEDVIDEIKQYKTKTELYKNNHGLYECCRKNGWLKYIHKNSIYDKNEQKILKSISIEEIKDLNLINNEKYEGYYIDIKNNKMYHKLKKRIHELKPYFINDKYLGYYIRKDKKNNNYNLIPYHILLGEFLGKNFNVVYYKDNNIKEFNLNNIEYSYIDINSFRIFPQFPWLYVSDSGFIYDSKLMVIYYGDNIKNDIWYYKNIDMSKLCYSLYKEEIRNENGYIKYNDGNTLNYSINNLSFVYNKIDEEILMLNKTSDYTEFIINVNNTKIVLTRMSDEHSCYKLYEDLKERIKENKHIDQWIYSFMENILPIYENLNDERNNLKKRTESCGCYWWETRKKWKSKIYVNDKEYSLGYFDTFEEGKFLYEMAVLSIKYNNFNNWYNEIKMHRKLTKQIFQAHK